MKLMIAATDELKAELSGNRQPEALSVTWVSRLSYDENIPFYIDLLFDKENNIIEELFEKGAGAVIINDVLHTPSVSHPKLIRVNAWPGFLKNEVLEASGPETADKMAAAKIFAGFGKKTEWLPPSPGFVAPRVISMIINEAYLALEEGVSSKNEIDTAMKTGTNYPYGPFEWARKIGLKNIYQLLVRLTDQNKQFQPAALLQQEVQY